MGIRRRRRLARRISGGAACCAGSGSSVLRGVRSVVRPGGFEPPASASAGRETSYRGLPRDCATCSPSPEMGALHTVWSAHYHRSPPLHGPNLVPNWSQRARSLQRGSVVQQRISASAPVAAGTTFYGPQRTAIFLVRACWSRHLLARPPASLRVSHYGAIRPDPSPCDSSHVGEFDAKLTPTRGVGARNHRADGVFVPHSCLGTRQKRNARRRGARLLPRTAADSATAPPRCHSPSMSG